jgi:hypothetical protein
MAAGRDSCKLAAAAAHDASREEGRMTKTIVTAVLATAMLVPAAFGASVKSYQVTGPVVEVTSDKIVVMKGKDKWELAKDASTKTTGEVKPGDKVTVHYTMTATDVEAKGETGAAKSKSKKSAH